MNQPGERETFIIPDLGRTLTALPALLDAGEGPESFASHVDRVAAHQIYPLPATTLLARAGVMTADRFDALPYGYGVTLTEEARRTFARVFALSEAEVRAMLLSSLDGRVFDLTGLDVTDPSSVRAVATREWAGFAGSSCCPACLSETGAWRLRWKLWFSFACLTHQTLLMSRCPRCDRRTGNYRADQSNAPRFATLVPRPGYCANPLATGYGGDGRAAQPCGQPLGQVETLSLADAPRLLETQRGVIRALETDTAMVGGEPASGLSYFNQLRSLTAMVIYIDQPQDLGELPAAVYEAARSAFEERDEVREGRRGKKGAVHHPYKAPPTDPALVAAVLPLVCEVLAQPDRESVSEALQPLLHRLRQLRGSGVRTVAREFHFSGMLDAAFGDLLLGRATFDRALGVRAGDQAGRYLDFKPDHVPPLLWLGDYRRDFAPLLTGLNIGETFARATISMALVKLCRDCTWEESVTALGLDGFLTSGNSIRIIGHLREHGHTTAFQEHLHVLGRRLEAQEPRLDHRARRAALEEYRAISLEDWEPVAWATGLKNQKRAALMRNGAAWIWARVTSSAPIFSPALSGDPDRQDSLREVYRRFEKKDLPVLTIHLERLARELEAQL